MNKKYLLYIDILGFSDLSKEMNGIVKSIYETIDELNAHRDNSFKTIVFSDTILVSNIALITDERSHETHVMFLCEFAQDLLYRAELKKLKIPFRAILSYGEFEYYDLENISCYHGAALIESYKMEKEINGVGLFIHKSISRYNRIFKTIDYSPDLSYVFLLQTLDRYYSMYEGATPIASYLIEVGYDFYRLPTEIDIIKNYYKEARTNLNPKVRSKYLQTYQFFKLKYPIIINKLELSNFEYSVFNDEVDWELQRHE